MTALLVIPGLGLVIEVDRLTKSFPLADGGEVLAVDGLCFEVGAGEVFGLLGPNGAGKTTTVRMLLGLLKPTSGHAAIGGFRSTRYPDEVKRRVGLVSANAGLYQRSTVREILHHFAELYGVPYKDAKDQILKLSATFGVSDLLERRCQTLSTGQRQRVQLARALVHDPPVVLLDEPTLGLDVVGSQIVQQFIERIRDEGRAAILCTHRLDEAERVCTRFGLIHQGRFVYEGTLDQLRAQTKCASLVEMFLMISGVQQTLSAQWDQDR